MNYLLRAAVVRTANALNLQIAIDDTNTQPVLIVKGGNTAAFFAEIRKYQLHTENSLKKKMQEKGEDIRVFL